MTIDEIIKLIETEPEAAMSALKEKTIIIPAWDGKDGLKSQYDPTEHPVMDKALYPDKVLSTGGTEKVTRITIDLQRLAVKRMTELVCGIPVKRVYKPKTDKQKEIAAFIESIYQKNRIDAVNIERLNLLYAGCEVITLWYGVEQQNSLYGIPSKTKIRCRNYSPIYGDELYPLFDAYGDMIALSIGYMRKQDGKEKQFFDTYTAEKHIKLSTEDGGWSVVENDDITIGKIPGVYVYRPTPIWENSSGNVYEMEWALSRDGNYLRKNSKPLLVVTADNDIKFGQEKSENEEFRSILQYPKGSGVNYVTWSQAIDNLKFYMSELRNLYFTQLQLPDWSYEKMSQQAISGESRKQLFIDCQLKVKDESGRLLEFFDREMNVVKAFAISNLPTSYRDDVESLETETQITPFTINDEKELINNLVNANGGKPVISQRESIELLGRSQDVDQTMKEIAEENTRDVLGGYE